MTPSATTCLLAFSKDSNALSVSRRRDRQEERRCQTLNPASRPKPGRWKDSWQEHGSLLQYGLFLCCLCLYWNSLDCSFVFDDRAAIEENKDLRSHVPWSKLLKHDFWGTPIEHEGSHKSYRPLTVASFRLNYSIGKLSPTGYHLINVILHTLVTLVFVHVCQRVGKLSAKTSVTAAALFAVHPIHTEAVTSVVGRAELLSCLFFLLALISHERASTKRLRRRLPYLLATILFTVCATLSKEQGITVLGVCIMRELLGLSQRRHQRIAAFNICVLTVSSCALMWARLRLMGSQLPVFNRFDNPAAAAATPFRQLTWAFLPSLNLGLLLNPSSLCCDWTRGAVPVIKSYLDHRNMITAITLIGLFCFVLRKKSEPRVLLGLALLVFPFLPASNLFFPVGFVVAERVLYLPSLGFCMLVSMGYHRMSSCLERRRRLLGQLWLGLLPAMLLIHGLKVVARNNQWKDELSLFRSGLTVTQDNAKLFHNVGRALHSRERDQEALQYFGHSIKLQRDDIGGYLGLGQVLEHLGRETEAEIVYSMGRDLIFTAQEDAARTNSSRPLKQYRQASVPPSYLKIFLKLADLVSKNASRVDEAVSLYEQVIEMRSDFSPAYLQLGALYHNLNQTEKAVEIYKAAIKASSASQADLAFNLAVVLRKQGRTDEARQYVEVTLGIDPEHEAALLLLASELPPKDLSPEAAHHRQQHLLEQLTQASQDVAALEAKEKVEFQIGMIYADRGQVSEAEQWLQKSLQSKHDFEPALFNLALLISQQERWSETKQLLTPLLHHNKDHVKGWLLLGDLFVSSASERHLPSAEQCFRTVLNLRPGHVQAMHNLCVVMVEAGDLEGAMQCLGEAEQLAPHATYIRSNREVVEQKLRDIKAASSGK